MRYRNFCVVLLALGLLGTATWAMAQDYWPSEPRPPKTIGDRLSDLGRSIFGEPPEERAAQPQARPHKAPANRSAMEPAAPRAGSIRTAQAPRADADSPEGPAADFRSSDGRLPTRADGRPAASATRPMVGNVRPTPAADGPRMASNPAAASVASEAASPPAPLHERMQGSRRSAFGGLMPSQVKSDAEPAADPPVGRASDSSQTPTLAPRRSAPSLTTADRFINPNTTPAGPITTEAADAKRDDAAAGSQNDHRPDAEAAILFARKSPVLSVRTMGPRRISVGKEAAYEVTMQNSGDVAAEEVTVFVSLPPWAEVTGADASAGATRPAVQGNTEPFQWNVGRVEPKGREKLTLRVVPRQSKPFDLGVRWDYQPAGSQTTIEVQEPKLAIRLEGPREVMYGKREVYKLKLSNTGSGAADNVSIHLMPVGAGDNQAASHKLGTVAAGEERTIEVELTARQAGDLVIQVEAQCDAGVRADLAEKVFVRKADVQIEMEGPSVQYVGTPATYRLRVRNPGNAPAKNIKMAIALPTGVKFLSASDGGRLAPGGNKVQWVLETLEPGVDRSLSLKCNLALSGPCKLECVCSGDEELAATAEATTRVDAIADLRLEVKDPDGPIPVGEEATYELRIRNRGTKTAQDVEVVAYFSNGIEPTGAEGQAHRVGPGQVVFSPIAGLAASSDMTLKIRAKADAAGSHVFRVEVHCRQLGTRLVHEESTHFYKDGGAIEQASRSAGSTTTTAPVREPLRTAARPSLGPSAESSPANVTSPLRGPSTIGSKQR